MDKQEIYLNVAGITVRVMAEAPVLDESGLLEEYRCAPGPVEHTLRASLADTLPEPRGAEVYSQGGLRVFREGETVRSYIGSVASDPLQAHTCVCRTGNEATVRFRRSQLPQGITGRMLLNAMELPHLLTVHDGLLLHASFIEYRGRAILFTAPSETGKSTQAQLWCRHFGAELVNGDRAGIRVTDGKVHACGTPFSGSSPVRRNLTLPLGAIVRLSQAPENTITRLRGLGAFRPVWEGLTVNTWDRRDMETATMTLLAVVGRVPVFHLACTPDVRAVTLLKETLEVIR